MNTLGLIGFPLGHSFSVSYFKEKFVQQKISDFEYRNFEIPKIEDLLEVIKEHKNLVGFNVTIPYKEQIIPFLDELSEDAKRIGAVNTVKVLRTEKGVILKGFNTDCYGFKESIKPFLASNHSKALILGTGGAAKAVEYILTNLGLEVLYVSRKPSEKNEVAYEDLNQTAIQNFPFIINSTPLGMHPKIDQCPPIPYSELSQQNYLYDLVYNPSETLFMKKGKEQGAIVQNGLQMLQLQAEKAWEIWNDPML